MLLVRVTLVGCAQAAPLFFHILSYIHPDSRKNDSWLCAGSFIQRVNSFVKALQCRSFRVFSCDSLVCSVISFTEIQKNRFVRSVRLNKQDPTRTDSVFRGFRTLRQRLAENYANFSTFFKLHELTEQLKVRHRCVIILKTTLDRSGVSPFVRCSSPRGFQTQLNRSFWNYSSTGIHGIRYTHGPTYSRG